MLFIIVQPLVLGYGQSVGTIVMASDWPEGQEHAAQAVGGRQALLTSDSASGHAGDLSLVSNFRF